MSQCNIFSVVLETFTTMKILNKNTKITEEKLTKDIISDVMNGFGFDYAGYVGSKDGCLDLISFSNFPKEWEDYYIDNDLHISDPTFTLNKGSQGFISWEDYSEMDDHRDLFLCARDFGVTETGLTIPVASPCGGLGFLCVNSALPKKIWRAEISRIMPDLQRKAAYIHDIMMKYEYSELRPYGNLLSEIEILILQKIIDGCRLSDLGDATKLPDSMIRMHLRSACVKTSSFTVPQAIQRAISLGLVGS